MIGRLVLCGVLLLSCAEALVDFTHSRIYDEFDFQGQSTVTIDGLCQNTCAIYASITPESKKFAANLLLQMPKGFTSIAEIASQLVASEVATGQKLPFIVNNTASLTIVNANAQLAAGPLVLYVVYNGDNYPENPQPEVYEAGSFMRKESTLPGSVTVMSAVPFTVTQARKTDQKGQGAFAILAGYKNMDEHYCPYVYYSIYDPFPGFAMEVNGPIVSLMWDSMNFPGVAPGELSATIGITNKRRLERSGWVSSPGYHGCPGLPPYRSSLYNYATPFQAEITNAKPVQVSLEVSTNSDSAHAVFLTDESTGAHYSVSNVAEDTSVTYTFKKTQNVTIDWTPDGTASTHFLAQWHSLVQP